MALKDNSAEPSMEEILASIRRIISEDGAPPADEPLDLSSPADAGFAPPPAAPPEPDFNFAAEQGGDDDLVFDDEPVEEAAPPPPVVRPVAVARPVPGPAPETIVSTPVVNQTAGAMNRLVGTLRISDTQGQTVEGVVRELLQPMLKEWLDLYLPAIVEAKVEAELERISRLAR